MKRKFYVVILRRCIENLQNKLLVLVLLVFGFVFLFLLILLLQVSRSFRKSLNRAKFVLIFAHLNDEIVQ